MNGLDESPTKGDNEGGSSWALLGIEKWHAEDNERPYRHRDRISLATDSCCRTVLAAYLGGGGG